MVKQYLVSVLCLAAICTTASAQDPRSTIDPKETEYYSPVPKVVKPGAAYGAPPSDAIVLFGGKNMNNWVLQSDSSSANQWPVSHNIVTVDKKLGDIRTKQRFMDFQLHLEYRIPENITGTGQARGNSGIFLAMLPFTSDAGYEVQVLDNYTNTTYVNGQAGSIYKQFPPLVNPCKKPGEWQSYDIVWTAPRFKEDGSLLSPGRATVLLNGVLVQNSVELKGDTPYRGKPMYRAHGACPIKLQAHGDKSEPISYRNIWVREL